MKPKVYAYRLPEPAELDIESAVVPVPTVEDDPEVVSGRRTDDLLESKVSSYLSYPGGTCADAGV